MKINKKINNPIVFGYIRVSTAGQSVDSQKTIIRDYCESKRMMVDTWRERTISSSKSEEERGINELIEEINVGDILLVSELSRLGRSNVQVNVIVHRIVEKGVSLHFCKQNFVINGDNKGDIVTKMLLCLFGMMAEFEQHMISLRTKGGLANAIAKGKKLGKRKGTKQKTMYDGKEDEIILFLKRGISLESIVKLIKIGKRKSLHYFIKTRSLKEKALKLKDNYEIKMKEKTN